MSIRDIAVIQIGPQPLFAWMGLLTLLFLITTAAYGYALIKGKVMSIPTHKMLAVLTLVIAAIHMTLALSILYQLPI
jgi:succinate dehydrogenase hydrophobic anchor subunit